MTTTLLEGETSRFTYAFGTLVQDVDHHGMFTFDQDDLAQRLLFFRLLEQAVRRS